MPAQKAQGAIEQGESQQRQPLTRPEPLQPVAHGGGIAKHGQPQVGDDGQGRHQRHLPQASLKMQGPRLWRYGALLPNQNRSRTKRASGIRRITSMIQRHHQGV